MPATDTKLTLYRQYFDEFLPSILGQCLMEDLRSLNCTIEIEVSDTDDKPWCLVIEEGCLTQVGPSSSPCNCRYVLDLSTLLDVVTAQCNPQEAFFDTRINIEGDMEEGLRLSIVLAEFFERFPFIISE